MFCMNHENLDEKVGNKQIGKVLIPFVYVKVKEMKL